MSSTALHRVYPQRAVSRSPTMALARKHRLEHDGRRALWYQHRRIHGRRRDTRYSRLRRTPERHRRALQRQTHRQVMSFFVAFHVV